jgi:hypothetical protein
MRRLKKSKTKNKTKSMQSKTRIKYILTLLRMAIIKEMKINKCCERYEKDPSITKTKIC